MLPQSLCVAPRPLRRCPQFQAQPRHLQMRVVHPQICQGRVRVPVATTRSSPAKVPRARVRVATTRSRRHVRAPHGLVRVPRQPVPRAPGLVLRAHVQVLRAARAVPLRVAHVPAVSHRAPQAQAEPQAAVQASVGLQVAALLLQVAVPQLVAAVVVEVQPVPLGVRVPGLREDGSPSAPSGWNTNSSRLHPLVACRFLAAMATPRCVCVAARR